MKKQDLEKMTVEQLKAYAASTDIDVSEQIKQKEIIEHIMQVYKDDETHLEVNAMRAVLIGKHKSGNKKAITADDCVEYDISAADFRRWVVWVDEFYNVVFKLYRAMVNHESSEDIMNARGRAFAAWRKLLRVGNEDQFHKNMYIDESDITFFVGFIQKFDNTTDVHGNQSGTFFCSQGKSQFRRQVEALIGCRIAANKLLDDDDYELLKTYAAAVKTKNSCDKRISGDENNLGLEKQIEEAEKHVEEVRASMAALQIEDKKINEFLSTDIRNLSELKKALEDTQKNKVNAEATITAKQGRYDAIMATLKGIE